MVGYLRTLLFPTEHFVLFVRHYFPPENKKTMSYCKLCVKTKVENNYYDKNFFYSQPKKWRTAHTF